MAVRTIRFTKKGVVTSTRGSGKVDTFSVQGINLAAYPYRVGPSEEIQPVIDEAIANAATVPPYIAVAPAERTENLTIVDGDVVLNFGDPAQFTPSGLSNAQLNGRILVVRDSVATQAQFIGMRLVGEDDDPLPLITLDGGGLAAIANFTDCRLAGGNNQSVIEGAGLLTQVGFVGCRVTSDGVANILTLSGSASNTVEAYSTHFLAFDQGGTGVIDFSGPGFPNFYGCSFRQQDNTSKPLFRINDDGLEVTLAGGRVSIAGGGNNRFAQFDEDGTIVLGNVLLEQFSGAAATSAWRGTTGVVEYGGCAFKGAGTLTKDAGVTATELTGTIA